jgi:hypothetical protein
MMMAGSLFFSLYLWVGAPHPGPLPRGERESEFSASNSFSQEGRGKQFRQAMKHPSLVSGANGMQMLGFSDPLSPVLVANRTQILGFSYPLSPRVGGEGRVRGPNQRQYSTQV